MVLPAVSRINYSKMSTVKVKCKDRRVWTRSLSNSLECCWRFYFARRFQTSSQTIRAWNRNYVRIVTSWRQILFGSQFSNFFQIVWNVVGGFILLGVITFWQIKRAWCRNSDRIATSWRQIPFGPQFSNFWAKGNLDAFKKLCHSLAIVCLNICFFNGFQNQTSFPLHR